MALAQSTMLPLGTMAPDFTLPNSNPEYGGKVVALDDFSQYEALLIVFMCNHCPYVIHIRERLAAFANDYRSKGLATVGISSNDVTTHPADAPGEMIRIAREFSFTFPYLHDANQSVAAVYTAACTPDFFLFDRDRRLVYRGQFDDSRPNSGVPVTGKDLAAAVDALLAGGKVPGDQRPSMGCNIKWKAGREPEYALLTG
ncbi:MAG: thioredoxin family protein [Gammaproteobacteria bacterium]|nr:thioredoxin family protein [Gammaproteobacteria bacterium]